MSPPWHITHRALGDYMRLRDIRNPADAALDLADLCARVAADCIPTPQDNGLLRYRAGHSDGRLRLLVTAEAQARYGRPALLRVLPSAARGRRRG